MRIVCPQCGYSREIPSDKIPSKSSMATCPKCQFRFRFRGPSPVSRLVDDPSEPVYPPRPSRTSVAPEYDERPLVPPFEPRRPRAPERPPQPEPEPQHYGHIPPRPQARWLPDPEPEEPAYDAPEEQAAPAFARLGHTDRDPVSAPPRRGPEPEYTPQPEPEPDYLAEPAEEVAPPWERPAQKRPAAPLFEPEPEPETGHAAEPERPESPGPAGDESTGPDPMQDLASEDIPPSEAVAGEDSVRDIWARLQAMGSEPKTTAARASKPSGGETAAPRPLPIDTVAPWEQFEHYGVVPAFTNTIKNIMLRPGDFFDQLPPVSGKLRPLVFALVLSVVSMVFVLVWNYFGLGPNFAELGRTDGFQGLGSGAIGGAALLGLAPILAAAFVFLDSALVHLLLGLLRAATRPFEETFRTICYAGGPWILTALPVPYSYLIPVVLIWHMTLQAIGLKKLHQSGYPQVLASVLVKWSLYFMASFAVLHVLITRK